MQFIGYKYQLAKLIKKLLYNFLIEHQLVCWPTALLPKYLLARFINILLFDILYVIDFSCKMPTSTYCKLELIVSGNHITFLKLKLNPFAHFLLVAFSCCLSHSVYTVCEALLLFKDKDRVCNYKSIFFAEKCE